MEGSKTFCFIICTNNDLLLSECILYINRLYIPDGWEKDLITITDAPSMAAGYNAAMKSSDAAIKIYLHQDLFIINRYFLFNILKILESDESIGLIGVVGYHKMSGNAVMWTTRCYGWVEMPGNEDYIYVEDYTEDNIEEKKLSYNSAVIDGCIMVSAIDKEWREDLFDGFDFYDASQCFEIRRCGKKVVTAVQESPWCIHDDGKILNFFNYNHYRKIFMKEYASDDFELEISDTYGIDNFITAREFSSDDEKKLIERIEIIELNKEKFLESEKNLIKQTDDMILNNDYGKIDDINNDISESLLNKDVMLTHDIMLLKILIQTVKTEQAAGKKTCIDDIRSFKEYKDRYWRTELYLRRIELDMPKELQEEAFAFIIDNNLSSYSLAALLYNPISKIRHREKIMMRIAEAYLDREMPVEAVSVLKAIVDPSDKVKNLLNER